MKKNFLVGISCCILITSQVNAQVSSSFEMRYFTQDAKANGETDFHGETEWMDLSQRIDFLEQYAGFAANYWQNPELNRPLLSEQDVKSCLDAIKPQPSTRIRQTLRLENWNAIGYKADKAQQQKERWKEWTATGATISNGALSIRHARVIRSVPSVNWRFRFKTKLGEGTSSFAIALQRGESTVCSLTGERQNLVVSSGTNRQSLVSLDRGGCRTIELYGDFANRKLFLKLNGRQEVCCPIAPEGPQDFDRIVFASPQGEMLVEEVSLYDFVPDFTNRRTPYSIALPLFEDFEEVPSMNGWQEADYDDSHWNSVKLPSVHGGLAEKEESYYLRHKLQIGTFERATLHLETLDPGGEVWVNGQVAAVLRGRHPQDIDVTNYLLANSENVIAVRVKPYKAAHVMEHSPSDPYIGWQLGRTTLLLTHRCQLKACRVHTASLDGDRAVQTHRIVVQNRDVESRMARLEVNYYPWFPTEGERVASVSRDIEIRPSVDNEYVVQVPVEHPQLWETKSPTLYRVEVILTDKDGQPLDDLATTTGIRTIEQREGTLYVNHHVEMLNGAQIMGHRYPVETAAKTNRCVPAETIVRDLMMIKKMNGNLLRIHVHAEKDTIDGINDPRYAEYADQMGVYLLWQTAGWVREGEAWNVDFDGYPRYMMEVYNHPSIVMWEASNHPNRFKRHGLSDSNDYMTRIFQSISSADTSRLISPTSFWQHTHYGNYDGTIDYKGNPMTPTPVIMDKLMTRGSQDAYTGYGAKWSNLRKAPNPWAASCLKANEKCYFNFEHEESAAQPNWALVRNEPWYEVQSYEWEYEEGSIGRKLQANEWRVSQAFQAFSAWESMKKQTLLGYDGFSWCSLESGANMFTYQKPLVDAVGVPKLAYYANKQVFQRRWAGSQDVDVVYGPDDVITPVIFNLADEAVVDLKVTLVDPKGKRIEQKVFRKVHLPKGRSVTTLPAFRFRKAKEGCYAVLYDLF